MIQKTIGPNNIRRILLVRTDRIGDVLLSMPVAAAIKAARPDIHIAFLLRNLTTCIGEHNPSVDNILTIDNEDGTKKSFFSLIKEIRKEKYDCAVLLHPEFNLAFKMLVSGIPIRVGTAYRIYSFLMNYRHREHRKVSLKHEAEYNLGLLNTLEIPYGKPEFVFEINKEEAAKAQHALASCGIQTGKPFCVIHPGSGGSAMDWPPGHYAKAARNFGEKLELPVIVTWGAGEEETADRVVKESRGKAVALQEILPIPSLASLLKRSLFVLAPSTGVLHLADTVGTKVIGLFPPVTHMSTKRWGPYRNIKYCLTPEMERKQRTDASSRNETSGLEFITPDAVLGKAREILAE